MIFAVRKLGLIGVILAVTLGLLVITYPISLQVAATRSELKQVEDDLAAARQRNRLLANDVAVLANAYQLERWNREWLGYVAPTSINYVSGERALANLDRLRDHRGAVDAPVLIAAAQPPQGAGDSADAADADAQIASRARMTDIALADIAAASTPHLELGQQ
jgi:hypothetical protein